MKTTSEGIFFINFMVHFQNKKNMSTGADLGLEFISSSRIENQYNSHEKT